MNIIKEELQFEESIKQRLEFICEFSKVKPIFINGSIRKIEMKYIKETLFMERILNTLLIMKM